MTVLAGPAEVVRAAQTAAAALDRVLSPSEVRGSRGEWAEALGELQRVADVVAAVQDVALVRIAAIEPGELEDGTLVETHRAPDHVALDAAGIVSGALNVSAVHAEHRVFSAVRLVVDGPDGSDERTGLRGLHEAMAAGRLDRYRAGVIAEELEAAPAEVAESVVAAVEPWFGSEDGPSLRRRCRRVLARISPDLLRQRAVRARADSRLERWASEPGVDTWHGTFPSEEAATAWAAVDALAQRYVADGTCERIDRARAKALTDLVSGHATVDVQVLLTVPAHHVDGTEAPGAPDGSDEEGAPDGCGAARRVGRGEVDPGRRLEPGAPPASAGEVGAARAGPSALDAGTDRNPGRTVGEPGDPGDLVEVAGARPGEPLLVARAWLVDAVAASEVAGADAIGRVRVGRPGTRVAGRADRRMRQRHRPCHPVTGGRVDPDDQLATASYRPSARLAALVRARDGRCRFPGCHVAARFCDLDHVAPWPVGATAAANLVCLCRRHHRVKQRPGWQVRPLADGRLSWTDPAGTVRVTHPVDALHGPVLPPAPGEPRPEPCSRGSLVLTDGPHSILEFTHEHRASATRPRRGPRAERCQLDPGRRYVVDEPFSGGHAGRHAGRRRQRRPPSDVPPF